MTQKLSPAAWNREINDITAIGRRPTRRQKIAAYIRYITAR